MNTALTSLIRSELLHIEGVRKLPPARRFASLLTSETAPECLFFLDSGFVKVIRRGEDAKEVILSIIGPGEVFAETRVIFVFRDRLPRKSFRKGSIYEIPLDVFHAFARLRPEAWQMLWEVAMHRQLEARKQKNGADVPRRCRVPGALLFG